MSFLFGYSKVPRDHAGIFFIINFFFGVCTLTSAKSVLNDTDVYRGEVCKNKECVALGNVLRDIMDLTADPCEDFYQFTCGKFMNTSLPENAGSLSFFTYIKNVVARNIKQDLEDTNQYDDEPLFVRNTKQFYQLCKNKEKKDIEGKIFLEELLTNLGGWPVLIGDKWNESEFNWLDTLLKIESHGLEDNSLFQVTIGVNLHNSSSRLIEIDTPITTIDGKTIDENLMEEAHIIAYHKLMMDVAILLGAQPDKIKDELWDTVLFEAVLAKGMYIGKSTNYFVTKPLNKLTEEYNNTQWAEYIKRKFFAYSIEIAEDEPISLTNEGYMEHIDQTLSSVSPRVVSNYLIWRAIFSLMYGLPRQFQEFFYEFTGQLTGVNAIPHPWIQCVTVASDLFNFAISYMYVKNHFNPNAKKIAESIVSNIKTEVMHSLLWLDGASQKEALKKLNVIESYIGYPEELMDPNIVQKFYNHKPINPNDTYLQTYLNIRKFKHSFKMSQLRRPANKKDWKRHAEVTDVNAFYSVVDNSIYLPAAVLQGVFFGERRPFFMNYGGIGYVIGHEMTHAFDIQGSMFDYAGNMRDWWSKECKDNYMTRSQCVQKQYEHYFVKQIGKRLDGKLTASENMADTGGLKAAYSAYVKKYQTEARLVGFENFTVRQMFWIAASSIWCFIYRDEALEELVRTGVHAPGEFRVNGALSNQNAFAEDFNCPVGSPMNPTKKCAVWDLKL